jgi:hypothetical protein
VEIGPTLQVGMRVSLDSDGRPVGVLEGPAGTPRSFDGWIELMTELSRLFDEENG